MELVLDLHLHSRYSRAVSQRMNIPNMYIWGRKKGINILSVTDYTHPLWFSEARRFLEELNPGIYKLKNENPALEELGELAAKPFLGPYFMLSTELSLIYSENGVPHRIHNLVFSPNFETAEKINKELANRGFNLSSDGRPILGISARNLAEMLFEINPKIAIIPCHVWTPWFSLYGSRSGYDRIGDCFGEFAKYIFAVETGLSSDPSMNWRIKELETRSVVSFSDAHSLEKMGREATVLRKILNTKSEILNKHQNLNSKIQNKNAASDVQIAASDITYDNILNSFVRGRERVFKIGYTIEFYPEEGKYHYTGHRTCGVSFSPDEDKNKGTNCPVCKKELTVGVMHRVEDLATFPSSNFTIETDQFGVVWMKDPKGLRPSYVSLVPLLEVLSESLSAGVATATVLAVFNRLILSFGSEHEVLFRSPIEKIRELAGNKVAEGIQKVRSRNISIKPGFDGEYGKVSIWSQEGEENSQKDPKNQMGLTF